MKRKRGAKTGHKKGKKKDPNRVDDPVPVNTEDISSDQNDDLQVIPEPPSAESYKLSSMSNIDADLPNGRPTGKAGRVKVKLRSSRVVEPGKSYSDVQTPSDTSRSNPKVALETNDGARGKDDSMYSDGQTSDMHGTVSDKIPWKTGSIKIKSSRNSGLLSDKIQDKNLNKLNSPPRILSERNPVILHNEKVVDLSVPQESRQREIKSSLPQPHYNKKELSAALAVIKKVMKMEAAVPFNTPVNPVALGIPDYFDIIDNPMDFGTICHDLETGTKYMNSEDVFKDVQYIWENCFRYNNKGDYIIDLMKRVKKNFMKYWISDGLYTDMSSTGNIGSTTIGDDARNGHDKLTLKSKTKHKRRRYGIDRHKSDCMCAVCVVRRRRKERDESQMATSDNLSQELKLEGSPHADNHFSEDAASSLGHSPETDANVDAEEDEIEEKMETPGQIGSGRSAKLEIQGHDKEFQYSAGIKSELLHHSPLESGSREDSKESREEEMDMDFVTSLGDQKSEEDKEEPAATHHQEAGQKHGRRELAESKRLKRQGSPSLQENHSALHLCRGLFPSKNSRSIWNGPHSLFRRHTSVQNSLIDAAMAELMKQ